MTAINQVVRINRGDSAEIFIALTNPDGSPFDPEATGVIPRYRIAPTSWATDAQALVAIDGIGPAMSVVSGGLEIALSPTQTDLPPTRSYYQELRLDDADDIDVVMTGVVFILPALRMGLVHVPAPARITLSSSAPSL